MRIFLGVDGGGSKTGFALVDEAGNLRAQTQGRSCYYFTEGIDLVERVLRAGVTDVCARAGIRTADITHAFFGLPSYGEVREDIARLDAAPRRVLAADYTCDNDMVCGWAGSLAGSDGINVISGTGSMTYGERQGIGGRVGGWGELFGDEGSAYWFAISGLNAFTRMSDGRISRGPLYDAMRRRVGIDSDLDLVDIVLNRWRGERGSIADLSKVVVEAASAGDEESTRILREGSSYLVELVEATRAKLDFGIDEVTPVSYSGGMFSASAIRLGFERELAASSSPYEVRTPRFSPVVGAALYAAKTAGSPLSETALARLRSSGPAMTTDRDYPPSTTGSAVSLADQSATAVSTN